MVLSDLLFSSLVSGFTRNLLRVVLKHYGQRHTNCHNLTVCVQTRHLGLAHLKEQTAAAAAAAEALYATVRAALCGPLSLTADSSTSPPISRCELKSLKIRRPQAVKPSVWSLERSAASWRDSSPNTHKARQVEKWWRSFFFFFTFSAPFNTKSSVSAESNYIIISSRSK